MREDGAHWVYQYDNLGQVTSGKKYWADGTPVAGQQFEYAFDDIGNRTQTRSGGDAAGGNLRTAAYTANALNQYTQRDIPGYVEAQGGAAAQAAVTVNGTPATRQGEYFRAEIAVDNTAAPVALTVTNQAVLGSDTVVWNRHALVAATPEPFQYDADGNLLSDGKWTYTWDAENRLVSMESGAGIPAAQRRRLDFACDAMGRRIYAKTQACKGVK